MIDKNDEILQDFMVAMDDYYERIQDGIALMQNRQIAEGIDTIFRPLHTIKGTSGFIGGLDALAGFSHQVEDYLKKLQNNDIEINAANIELMVEGLDEVFNLIDQVRQGADVLDKTEAERIADKLSNVGLAPNQVEIERSDGHIVLRIKMPRIHLPSQYQTITDALNGITADVRVALDLSEVRTIGSTAWGAIWKAGEEKNLSAVGMKDSCSIIFHRWGFGRFIKSYQTLRDFLDAG